jgi:hypothetical protein
MQTGSRAVDLSLVRGRMSFELSPLPTAGVHRTAQKMKHVAFVKIPL